MATSALGRLFYRRQAQHGFEQSPESRHSTEAQPDVEIKARVFRDINSLDDSVLKTTKRVGFFVLEDKIFTLNIPFFSLINGNGALFGLAFGAVGGGIISYYAVQKISAVFAVIVSAVGVETICYAIHKIISIILPVNVSVIATIVSAIFCAVKFGTRTLPPVTIHYDEDFQRLKLRLYNTPHMKELLAEVPELRVFKCSFTQSLILMPMQDNFGNTYEQAEIMDWIQKHPKGNNSPYQRGTITELHYNKQYFSRLTAAFKKAISRKIPHAQEVFDNYLKIVKSIRDDFLDRISSTAFRYGREHEIPLLEVVKNLEITQTEYGL